MTDVALTSPVVSAAVDSTGWRVVYDGIAASVAVASLQQALQVAAAALATCGEHTDDHLRVDVRADRVELVLRSASVDAITARDTDLAAQISGAVHGLGLSVASPSQGRPVQLLEVAIDAMDIARIRPFWLAVFGYRSDAIPADDPGAGVMDPARQLPTIWFQQMDEPRPQRNRIHFDLHVAHDAAQSRIASALEAGGTLVSDAEARAFWILADAEGNEICICTWQDRG